MNKDCPKRNWPILGCKFEPRSDWIEKIHPGIDLKGQVFIETLSETINALKHQDKIYVCDICVRCGFQIKRP